MLFWLKPLFFIWSSYIASAVPLDEVTEITIEETVPASNPAIARQMIFDSVIKNTSTKYITEIIGEPKYEHNKSLIKNKILKNSGKYILSLKSSPPVAQEKGYTMSVTLKLSLKNLQALLLEEGLLYKLEGSPQVLPMINFQDRINGQNYQWWIEDGKTVETGFVVNQAYHFYNQLREEMRDKGFYCFFPMGSGYRNMIPTTFVSDNPRPEDMAFMGEYFGTQIVVKGDVRYSKSTARDDTYRIDVKMMAVHSGNGRIVGEVIRTYETDSGSFQVAVPRKSQEVIGSVTKDLAAQVFDAWKRGTFGSNLLKLSVEGHLNYMQMSHFKKWLLAEVREIRSIKERLFDNNQVTFEMDSASGTNQIATLIKKVDNPPFQIAVLSSTSDILKLKVEAR